MSFADHPRAQFWSAKNNCSPNMFSKSSDKKFLFDCNVCNHTFYTALSKITIGKWCPYCSSKKLCGSVECKNCFEKSFASHPKVKYWSKKNELNPYFVFKNGDRKIWFDCNICSHPFSIIIKKVSGQNQWCSYCFGYKLCGSSDCLVCFERSFGSHPKSKNWSLKNIEHPNYIFKGSNRKYWFDCGVCNHSFSSAINNVVYGYWCPKCVNKNQRRVFEYLENIFNPEYVKLFYEFKEEWTKNPDTNHHLKYDIAIHIISDTNSMKKIFVEVDGEQHFKQVLNWESPEHQKKRDEFKNKLALENGYSIIRLPIEYVYERNSKKYQDTWQNVLFETFLSLDSVKEPTLVHIEIPLK